MNYARWKNSLTLSLILIILFFFVGNRLWGIATYSVTSIYSAFLRGIFSSYNACADHLGAFKNRKNSIEELEKEFIALKKCNENLRKENIELHAVNTYHQEIRELASFRKRYHVENAIIAQVLIRSFLDKEHYFIVGAGSHQGVTVDTVVLYNNALVGRVVAVYPWHSKVILISDASCSVAVYCAKTGTRGIHEGTNKSDITAVNYVDVTAKIDKDDLIISSGQGLVFPRGFALGRVLSWEDTGIVKKIVVKPLINLCDIDHCLLVKPEHIYGKPN